MARELAGFMWAIAREVAIAAEGPIAPESLTQQVFQDVSEKTQPRFGVTLGGVEAGKAYSCRDRGRHPTDASQVVTNPRIAAGSTVACYWLRLFRCTEDKKNMKT